jgi:CheY-like chemotaxis protein
MPIPPEHPRITVVNDNPEFLQLMQDLLQDATYPATLIDGGRPNAVELIEAAEPHVLIIDLRMGSQELHGWEVLKAVRLRPALRTLPTVICTGDAWATETLADDVAAMPNVAILHKPFTIDALYAAIEDALASSVTG